MFGTNSLGFVNVPKPEAPLSNSGEGGVEFWLIVRPPLPDLSVRRVCMTGFTLGVITYDAIPSGNFSAYVAAHQSADGWRHRLQKTYPQIECAVCIGATRLSLWDDHRVHYWSPQYEDLTDDGKKLYDLIAHLYGMEPEIVVVLDT